MKKQIILRLLTFDILSRLLLHLSGDAANRSRLVLADPTPDHDRLLNENKVPADDLHASMWNGIVEGHREDPPSDKAARLLIAGRTVTILDRGPENMHPARGAYAITMENIADGLARALDGRVRKADREEVEFLGKSVKVLLGEDGRFDPDMAILLWQVILFDEVVYVP